MRFEATIDLELDTAERTVEVSPELRASFPREPELRAFFESLSYTHRNEYVRWIENAKRGETRRARATEAVGMLRNGVRRRASPPAGSKTTPRPPPTPPRPTWRARLTTEGVGYQNVPREAREHNEGAHGGNRGFPRAHGPCRDRTYDLGIKSPLLYQLS